MKKMGIFMGFLALLFALPYPLLAQKYNVHVLQVSKVAVFENGYQGFIEALKAHGLVQGDNLTITRHIIDADLDAGLWKKVGILFQIRKTASKIVEEKPDLVLTIGTPATRYSKDKLASAGIPVVFSCVANPVAAGCPSMTNGGPGTTGATIYIDPHDVIKITKLALPHMKSMGIIHCDDDNAIAFAEEARKKGAKLGVRVLTKQVGKSDKIAPAAQELIAQGIDAFGIPPDTYYALRNNEPSKDILAITREKKIPAVAFMTSGSKGCILYVGPSLRKSGFYAGEKAARILKQGFKPEAMPIEKQDDLTILSDTDAIRHLGITIPIEILQLAKPFTDTM